MPADDRLKVVERVAAAALTELPHTPVTAVGVNFQFVEEDPQAKLLAVFNSADLNVLADAGFNVRSTQLRRELLRDNVTTNLSLALSHDRKVLFDFNYHCDGNLQAARAFIEGKVVTYKERALDLMRQTYGLEL